MFGLGLQEWVVVIGLAVLGVASTVATMTPNKADDWIVQMLLNVVNVIGMNVGKAKNKD